MTRFPFVLMVALSLGVGCNRPTTEKSADVVKDPSASNVPNAKIATVRGCLTGSNGQFVLTSLEHGATDQQVAEKTGQPSTAEPVPTTESYRLIGMDEKLGPLVGQRVSVSGIAAPEQVVDMVSATPANPPTTPGGTAGTTGTEGKVETASRARVEIHDLRVSSVTPLGDKCLAQ